MQDDIFPEPSPAPRRRRRFGLPQLPSLPLGRWIGRFLLALLILVLLYYPIGMFWVHRIDDDTGFQPGEVPAGASRAVAIAAALIDREVNSHEWVANDPFFLPGWALDNMPNYQQGIIGALSQFAIEMTDQIGRTRGSSEADADLDKAAGLLKYPGTVWLFDFSTSWAPTASSESQYRAAKAAFLAYNERLAQGQAVFERRSDNLLGTLDRIAADLGSLSATIDEHIETHSGTLIDFQVERHLLSLEGADLRLLPAAARAWRQLRKGDPGPRPDQRLEPDADQPQIRGRDPALGHPQRLAVEPVRAQSPRLPGLLSPARPHSAPRGLERSSEVRSLGAARASKGYRSKSPSPTRRSRSGSPSPHRGEGGERGRQQTDVTDSGFRKGPRWGEGFEQRPLGRVSKGKSVGCKILHSPARISIQS